MQIMIYSWSYKVVVMIAMHDKLKILVLQSIIMSY